MVMFVMWVHSKFFYILLLRWLIINSLFIWRKSTKCNYVILFRPHSVKTLRYMKQRTKKIRIKPIKQNSNYKSKRTFPRPHTAIYLIKLEYRTRPIHSFKPKANCVWRPNDGGPRIEWEDTKERQPKGQNLHQNCIITLNGLWNVKP